MKQEEFQTAATRVSLVSMVTNVVLTLLKLAAGLVAHSGAMISDAVHSASDIFSGVIVLIGVKISSKEPDEQHPYGHERYECVAALLLSGILAIVGGMIGITAVKDIISGGAQNEVPGMLALAAAVVSIVTKESPSRFEAARIVFTPSTACRHSSESGSRSILRIGMEIDAIALNPHSARSSTQRSSSSRDAM